MADGVAAIGRGDLDKVVLARTLTRGPIDTAAVLRGLADRFPACATFAFGVGDRAVIARPSELVLELLD